MLPLTNKYKLYLYIIFFIFLTSIFNFQFLESYQNKFLLKKINIIGLSNNEKIILEKELNRFQNLNIFKLSKENFLEVLNNFNFIENIYVNKIIPSTININLSKTSILGKTFREGENLYIGKNGKFINSNQVFKKNKTAIVFGNFKIEEFLDLYEILKKQDLDINEIDKYYYFKNKRWDLLFSNGQTLMLPSKNIEKSIKIFKKFSKEQNLINPKIIDLRITNQIILTNNNE